MFLSKMNGDKDFKKHVKAVNTHFSPILDSVAENVSAMERRGEILERDVADLFKAKYMKGCEGEVYDAVVSSVTHWGIYVTLENTVDGLINEFELGAAGYEFNEDKYESITSRKGRKKSKQDLYPGVKVTVRLKQVDLATMKMAFTLVDQKSSRPL